MWRPREASFEDCGFADSQTRTGLTAAFCNLEQARFVNCDLTLSLFDRSGLYGVEMRDCNLRGARFLKADFSKAFGRKVVRSSATFHDCNLELADLSDTRLAGCVLSDCDLRDADLTGADLEGADLTGSNLFHALIGGAKLAGADLRRAEISGLDLAALATREGLKITPDQQYPLLTRAPGSTCSPDLNGAGHPRRFIGFEPPRILGCRASCAKYLRVGGRLSMARPQLDQQARGAARVGGRACWPALARAADVSCGGVVRTSPGAAATTLSGPTSRVFTEASAQRMTAPGPGSMARWGRSAPSWSTPARTARWSRPNWPLTCRCLEVPTRR